MNKKKVSLFFTCLLLFVCISCSHRVLDFTVVSTKNIDLTEGREFNRGKQRVEGEDKVHIIIFIPTGTVSIEEAVDKAIEQTPGCVALLDGVIYSKFWWIPYIYGQSSAIVEGTPLIDPALSTIEEKMAPYNKVRIGRDGKVNRIEEISPEEYLSLKNRVTKESKETVFANSNELKLEEPKKKRL